jgi:hypothetical protein
MDPRALAHAQYFQRNPSIQADVVMRPRIHRRILDVTCRHLQSGGGFQGQEISPKTGQKFVDGPFMVRFWFTTGPA